MRILICRETSGSVAFPPGVVAGHAVTCERRYAAVDHVMILDDFPTAVLAHDVGYLLSVPGGLFRLPTPAEQDQILTARRAAAGVQEDDASVTTEDAPPAKAPSSSPAKKTAQGG